MAYAPNKESNNWAHTNIIPEMSSKQKVMDILHEGGGTNTQNKQKQKPLNVNC